MMSFDNAFSYDELRKFDNNVKKESGQSKIEYCFEPKIDEKRASLKYENGFLKTGATRGNGLIGEDITNNALGEVLLTKKILKKLISKFLMMIQNFQIVEMTLLVVYVN